MGVVNTTYTFLGTDTITSAKLNNIIDDTFFIGDAIQGTTLQVVSPGKLAVSAGGITSNELASNSVVAAKIANEAVITEKISDSAITTIKLANSTSSTTGVTTAKIADSNVTTDKLADGSVVAEKLSGAQTGSAPIFGARAWVNFNGTVAGTFAGGTSTVVRVAASTTATITTTNDHNLITGNKLHALTGVAVGTYVVTVTGPKTFTITTAATTALNTGITFSLRQIRGAGNVNSVTRYATGDFIVNFSIAMPSANYCSLASVGTNTSFLRMPVATSPYGELQFPERVSVSSFVSDPDFDEIGQAVPTDLNHINVSVFG
jgi:hypothetical protein